MPCTHAVIVQIGKYSVIHVREQCRRGSIRAPVGSCGGKLRQARHKGALAIVEPYGGAEPLSPTIVDRKYAVKVSVAVDVAEHDLLDKATHGHGHVARNLSTELATWAEVVAIQDHGITRGGGGGRGGGRRGG